MGINDLLEITKTVKENEIIFKNGMKLTYELPQKVHRKLNEELFYRYYIPTDNVGELEYSNIISVHIDGIEVILETKNTEVEEK